MITSLEKIVEGGFDNSQFGPKTCAEHYLGDKRSSEPNGRAWIGEEFYLVL
jgi:hypothetical protein